MQPRTGEDDTRQGGTGEVGVAQIAAGEVGLRERLDGAAAEGIPFGGEAGFQQGEVTGTGFTVGERVLRAPAIPQGGQSRCRREPGRGDGTADLGGKVLALAPFGAETFTGDGGIGVLWRQDGEAFAGEVGGGEQVDSSRPVEGRPCLIESRCDDGLCRPIGAVAAEQMFEPVRRRRHSGRNRLQDRSRRQLAGPRGPVRADEVIDAAFRLEESPAGEA